MPVHPTPPTPVHPTAPAPVHPTPPVHPTAPATATATAPEHPKPAPAPAPAKTQARGPESTVPPPSLTTNALRDELRSSTRRRQDELAAIARERSRLEKLSAEIATARAALEAETARLDEKVKKAELGASAATSQAQPFPSRQGGKPPAPTLAKTLKGMRAEQAATLISRLDRRLAADLLRQMRPADAGGVLEKMKPETAAELFSLMASSETGVSR